MNQLAFSLAGALALSSAAFAQDPTVDMIPFDTSNVTYLGVYDLATGTFTNPALTRGSGGPGLGDPIYNNSAPTGFFFNLIDGRTIIDEGRIPGTTSPDVIGTQDSYGISSIEISYVTDATDPTLGGTGVSLEVKLYESFAACGLLETTDAPVATLDITGLPGSTTGGSTGFVFDVDLTGMGICMRADGGGGYVDGTSDRFGWSMRVSDPADATTAGPFISGDPAVVPEGDGTVFQNPGGAGTGLDTADLWRQLNASGTVSCFFFGGYPANPFGSFHMIVRSDLAGDCIGCGIGDDRFEPNDDLASASPLEIDTYGGLISDGLLEDDYYAFTVPGDSEIIIDAIFEHANSDLDLVLYSAGAIIDTGFSTTDNEQVSFGNCDPTPVDLVVRVNNFSNICSEYDLDFSFNPLFADDALEDNDDCASAVPLPLGVTRDLIVRSSCGTGGGEDSDFYSYQLADGDTLTVDILFSDASADIDLILYDVSGGCPGTAVASGFSTTDNENASFTNTTGAPLDMVVRVDFFSGMTTAYDLVVNTGPATIGELICIGNDNSTGVGARLSATGSDVAADNNVTFDVTELPMNAMGYFIVSQDRVNVANPGGSQGDLCIGSLAIGRYSMFVLDSGAAGAVTFSPDLTVIPIAMGGSAGTIPAMAGDTFNWQYWTRDVDGMGGATSNFSDAVGISFN